MIQLSQRLLALLLILSVAFYTGCEDDDPEPVNEEEVITGVTFTMTPPSGDAFTYVFSDSDGDGPNAPVENITGSLQPNTTYQTSITFQNASDPNDIEDITVEIREEDEEHQIFYIAEDGTNLEFSYNDMDGDGNPIGLSASVTTGASGSGEVTIILRHEPDKEGDDVSDGDITNAGGETDIEIDFDVSY